MIRLSRPHRDARRRIKHTIEYGLPSVIEVPAPSHIRNTEWFRDAKLGDILQVYALPCYKIEKYSGKLMPALGILELDEKEGKFDDGPVVIIPSSGNFVKDFAAIAMTSRIREVFAILNYGTGAGKLNHVEVSGAKIRIAPKNMPATDYAFEMAQEHGGILINQYTHEGSIVGHKPTMNHIIREMMRVEGQAGFIFGAVTGTCSTLAAAHRYLRGNVPGNVKIMGVASMSESEKIPAARTLEEIGQLKAMGGFSHRPEWKGVLDFELVTSVTRREAFALNGERYRETALGVGPTGALLEAGFYHMLCRSVERGEIESLRNERGMITACLLWMDSHLPYIDDLEYRSALIGHP